MNRIQKYTSAYATINKKGHCTASSIRSKVDFVRSKVDKYFYLFLYNESRVIYQPIWNSLRYKITALLETHIAYRFNKPRKPGWTRRRCRPVSKVAVRMVQFGTSPVVSRRHVRGYRYVLYMHALYTLPSKRDSRDSFVTARAIADLSRVCTRSRWISLAIRQIDRIHFARGHARIITRLLIAPWHFPSRTTSKLHSGDVGEHQHRLSITWLEWSR